MATPNTTIFPSGLGVPDIDGANPSRLDPAGRFFEPREGVLRILGAWDIFRVTRAPSSPSLTPQRGDIHIQTPATYTGADPATTDPDAIFYDGSAWVALSADAFWCAIIKRVLACVISSAAGNDITIGPDGGLLLDVQAAETTTALSGNVATSAFTYTNEDGVVVSLMRVSAQAGNDIIAGADGGAYLDVQAAETTTTLTYNSTTKVLTYTNEDGVVQNVDLAALATDIYVNGGTFNSATMTLTLTDNDAGTPPITIPLGSLASQVTVNNATSEVTHTSGSGTVTPFRRVSADSNNLVGIGSDGGAYIPRAAAWTIV